MWGWSERGQRAGNQSSRKGSERKWRRGDIRRLTASHVPQRMKDASLQTEKAQGIPSKVDK